MAFLITFQLSHAIQVCLCFLEDKKKPFIGIQTNTQGSLNSFDSLTSLGVKSPTIYGTTLTIKFSMKEWNLMFGFYLEFVHVLCKEVFETNLVQLMKWIKKINIYTTLIQKTIYKTFSRLRIEAFLLVPLLNLSFYFCSQFLFNLSVFKTYMIY